MNVVHTAKYTLFRYQDQFVNVVSGIIPVYNENQIVKLPLGFKALNGSQWIPFLKPQKIVFPNKRI